MDVPGKNPLVDAHVHLSGDAGLEDLARAGIVAVREAGTKEGTGLRPAGEFPGGPLVVSAGWALFKKGGYGSRFGIPVDTQKEISAEILKLKRAGAGIIKIMASGMVSLKGPGTITPGGFSADEIVFIVGEAAAAGLDVMAHANGENAIMAAADGGVRSIEHGFFVTGRALDMLAKKNTFWVPTIGALARAGRAAGSPAVGEYISSLIRSHLEMLRRAYAMNVPLALGPDCVLPDPGYGAAYQTELSYFEQAGLSREEVLKIACEGGMKLLGV